MKKRNVSKIGSPLSRSIRKSITLDEINKKLNTSAALNGGFDTLLYKIDKIEQSQGQLVSKVDKIHDAIYDPSEGIFSKLSEYKLENTNTVNEIVQDVSELQIWRSLKDKEEVIEATSIQENKTKLGEFEKSVGDLVRNKNNALSVMKWFMVAFGGACITLLVKWIENKFH